MSSNPQLQKHRVTLLPDGVNVSDHRPVLKRSQECYDSVSPCHIPKIRVAMNILDDSEQISIKIPTAVLEKIPMLNDFQQVVEGGAPSSGESDTLSPSAADAAAQTGHGRRRRSASSRDANKQRKSKDAIEKHVLSSTNASSHRPHATVQHDAALGDNADGASNSAVLQLPGGSWGLLVMLKVLLDRHVDMDKVLLVDAIEPAGAAALAMAKYLGCDDVSEKIRKWLAGGLAKMGSDHSNSGQRDAISWRQVLDALPDEEFSLSLKQPLQLMSTTVAAVGLPARLKVKWLRADCLTVLDLRNPEVNLTGSSWKSLVMCLSVVPGLKELYLRLPRGEVSRTQAAPAQATSTACDTAFVQGYLCSSCDSDALEDLMDEAFYRGAQNYHFPVNVPAGVHATHISATCCARCRRRGALTDCRHMQRPQGQNVNVAPSGGQGDVTQCVSQKAIIGLLHASNIIKRLEVLDLVDSPVAACDIGTFCDAIVSFSATLTELSINTWKAQDNSTQPPTNYDVTMRRQVLDALARLKLLKKLRIRDWNALVYGDCQGGRVLGHLKRLERIVVGASYPCKSCADGECVHFDDALPFESEAGAVAT